MTDYNDLCKRLRELAYDRESRLSGTPMIPLHENTIMAVIDAIEAQDKTIAELRIERDVLYRIARFSGHPAMKIQDAIDAAMREGTTK